jgi:hypothetical protein
VKKLLCLLMFGATAAHASVVSITDPSNQSDIVTPEMATGTIRFQGFKAAAPTGDMVVCPKEDHWTCTASEWVTPQQAVSQQFPKARHVGFQVIEKSGGPVLSIYYKHAS